MGHFPPEFRVHLCKSCSEIHLGKKSALNPGSDPVNPEHFQDLMRTFLSFTDKGLRFLNAFVHVYIYFLLNGYSNCPRDPNDPGHVLTHSIF